MDKKEASQLINGRGIMRGLLSPPEGKQMVFALEPPFRDIWIADTAPLRPGRTLAEYYRERSEWEQNYHTRQIETYPEDEQYYKWRAGWHIRIGEKEKVLRDLERFTDLVNDPSKAAEAYHYVARRLIRRLHDPEIVLELYHKAHKLQPKNWKCIWGLGVAYYRTGQWENAITNLTESTKLIGGKNACNYLFLAMAHWQSDEKKEARNFYNKAIQWIQNNRSSWLSEYDRMLFSIFVETAELMDIEINDLFTKGELHLYK
jgi:tetratricopeptide (TPR) repeat protein